MKEKIYTLCSRADLIILRGQKSHVGKFLCDIYTCIFIARMLRKCGLAGTVITKSYSSLIRQKILWKNGKLHDTGNYSFLQDFVVGFSTSGLYIHRILWGIGLR